MLSSNVSSQLRVAIILQFHLNDPKSEAHEMGGIRTTTADEIERYQLEPVAPIREQWGRYAQSVSFLRTSYSIERERES